MNTLDEVIKILESARIQVKTGNGLWVDYRDNDDLKADALHYLNEYKNTDEKYKKAIAHVTEVVDYYEKMVADYQAVNNPPLTWDELKGMGGKPVWVEVDGKWWGRFWAFVEVENDSYINFFQKGQEYTEDLWKCNMGKTWNAFRKERE